MINIQNNFSANIFFKIETKINIATYTRVSQHYSKDDDCWVQEDPSYEIYDIYSIIGFHDATKDELAKNISNGVKYPTEFCVMSFYDEDHASFNSIGRKGWVFVVGNAKDNNKKLDELRDRHNKMIGDYYKEMNAVKEKYEKIMNAGD